MFSAGEVTLIVAGLPELPGNTEFTRAIRLRYSPLSGPWTKFRITIRD